MRVFDPIILGVVLTIGTFSSADACDAGHGCTRTCPAGQGSICIWHEPNGPCETECTPKSATNVGEVTVSSEKSSEEEVLRFLTEKKR
jgi:hypothetical protein